MHDKYGLQLRQMEQQQHAGKKKKRTEIKLEYIYNIYALLSRQVQA